jgi:hypothetical protein
MGKVLNKIARKPDVHCMVELGTWSGAGSTVSIGEGLRATEGLLFTVEAFEVRASSRQQLPAADSSSQ